MKKKDLFVNYSLSLSFILLFFLFLISLVGLSRFVLSDSDGVVSTTQNLLEEIDTVSKTVESNANLDSLSYITFDTSLSKLGVIGSSYLNLGENSAFLTLKFNHSLLIYDKYTLIEDPEVFTRGMHILYNVESEGIILKNDGKIVKVFSDDSQNIEEVEVSSIKGVILMINE